MGALRDSRSDGRLFACLHTKVTDGWPGMMSLTQNCTTKQTEGAKSHQTHVLFPTCLHCTPAFSFKTHLLHSCQRSAICAYKQDDRTIKGSWAAPLSHPLLIIFAPLIGDIMAMLVMFSTRRRKPELYKLRLLCLIQNTVQWRDDQRKKGETTRRMWTEPSTIV